MERNSFLVIFLLYICQLVYGKIIVRQINDSTAIDTFTDAPAGFGPQISEDGITGFVYNVVPKKACEPVQPPPDNTSVWIALISRDNCTFASKVRNVEKWYAAAIIYNTRATGIRIMPGDGIPVHIPSVFVGQMDGELLEKNYCYKCNSEIGKFIITVDSDDQYIFNPYLLWPFAVVVGTCFVLMLIFILVKWCRDIRRRRKSRLPSKHLKKIPTKKFKKGDDYDICAICLDDYEEGDKLRLLPCSHVYHTKCIDPWLTKNKRCCPICKRKIIPGDDPSSDSGSSDEGEGESQNERTPLLAGSSRTTNNNTRRSTFDNSGLPELYREQEVSRSNASQGQGHTGADSSSDQSDSEVGAVGGIPRVKLSSENLMKTLNLPSSSTIGQLEENVTNGNQEEHVVIETSQGSENQGFVVDGEDEESEEEYLFNDANVVFSDTNKKDEKKFNGVV